MADEACKFFRLNWRLFRLWPLKKSLIKSFALDDKVLAIFAPVDEGVLALAAHNFIELLHKRLDSIIWFQLFGLWSGGFWCSALYSRSCSFRCRSSSSRSINRVTFFLRNILGNNLVWFRNKEDWVTLMILLAFLTSAITCSIIS